MFGTPGGNCYKQIVSIHGEEFAREILKERLHGKPHIKKFPAFPGIISGLVVLGIFLNTSASGVMRILTFTYLKDSGTPDFGEQLENISLP